MFAFAGHLLKGQTNASTFFDIGARATETCYLSGHLVSTHIGPETVSIATGPRRTRNDYGQIFTDKTDKRSRDIVEQIRTLETTSRKFGALITSQQDDTTPAGTEYVKLAKQHQESIDEQIELLEGMLNTDEDAGETLKPMDSRYLLRYDDGVFWPVLAHLQAAVAILRLINPCSNLLLLVLEIHQRVRPYRVFTVCPCLFSNLGY
jgi:hypothetical protein